MGRKFEVRKQSMMKSGLEKTKLYSRFGREIYMCAKNGGSNPESNLALKHLIERAKKEQVPADIVRRNIEKADAGTGADYVSVRYEGFGPGGSSFIIDALSDNVNRTVADVRYCFTKIGAKLGVKGAVEHTYQHLSLVKARGVGVEEALEALIEDDIDVQDIETAEDGIEITAGGYELDKVERCLQNIGMDIVSSEQGWYPQEWIVLSDEDYEKYQKFMTLINDVEDVQNVYHNVME